MVVAEETCGAKIGGFFFFFISKNEKPFWTCTKFIKYQVRGKGITFICH